MLKQEHSVWGVFVGEKGYQLAAFNSQHGPFPPEPGTEGYIAIGWPAVGDMTLYENNYSDFLSKFRKAYANEDERVLKTQANMVWHFAFVMKEGDWVISPASSLGYLLVGEIISNYIPGFYDELDFRKATDEMYLHLRKVRWLYVVPKGSDKYKALCRIGQLTVTRQNKSTIDQLKSMLDPRFHNLIEASKARKNKVTS